MPMHEGEIAVNPSTVRRLLVAQAPELAGLPIAPVAAIGTVHHVFRVGDDHVVRLPRKPAWADDPAREAAVLDRVGAALPVRVPEVVLLGEPGEGYPMPWAVHRWVPGTTVVPSGVGDVGLAEDLAAALIALHAVDARGLPDAGRRPLTELDDATRAAIEAVPELDRDGLVAAWRRALDAPAWTGDRTTIHADLLPPNLVVDGDRLTGILDWGAAGSGDVAHDLVPAWSTLRAEGRVRFRALLAPVEGDWERARGIALHQALIGVPYYRETNPGFAAMCVATADEVLVDVQGSARSTVPPRPEP